MSVGRLVCCLSLASATALGLEDVVFDLTPQREILIAAPAKPEDSLIEGQIETTKHDQLVSDLTATDKWEQGFVLSARLPINETFSLKQDFRTGLQSETILGQELAATYRDTLTVLEKTSAELKASEAMRIAVMIQQQRLANNQIPFADIVTYGAEAALKPSKTTVFKLQGEWQQKDEIASADTTSQETYRLALEHELFPKRLQATVAASLVHSTDEDSADREASLQKLESSLRWTPLETTAFTLAGDYGDENRNGAETTATNYLLKLQQQMFPGAKLELQSGFERRIRETAEAITRDGAWSLGANSDFTLREDWAAGIGLRYRQRVEASLQDATDEVSFSLSVKGKF